MSDIVDGWLRRLESPESHRTYWVSFLVVFVVAFLLAFGTLWLAGGSLVWRFDGFEQQYPFFVMEGDWLRALLSNLASGNLEVPMWDPLVGYGADYVISVSNTLGNPINLISVFSTPQNAELLLTLTVPITLLLAGVTFSRFCLYEGWGRLSTLNGVVAYLFSGFTVITYTQILMLYPLVLAPVCLLGVEKVFDGRSPLEFVVGVGLCCLNSVSLGFNACLLLLAYCVVRFFFLPGDHGLRVFLGWFLRIFGYVVVAVLIGGVLFVPTALAVLSQGRIGLDRPDQLLYAPSYYLRVLAGLFSPQSVGADCFLGLAPVVAVSLVVLLARRNRGTAANVALVMAGVVVALLLLPVFGKLFNGFAYPNNRWVWAASLLGAVGSVVALDGASELDDRVWRRALAVLATALAVLLVVFSLRGSWATDGLLLFMGAALTVLMFATVMLASRSSRRALLAVLGLSLLCVFTTFGYWSRSCVPNNIGRGRCYDTMATEAPVALVSAQPDAATSRFATAGLPSLRNASLVTHVPDATFYNSMYNGYVDEYHASLALTSANFNFQFDGFASRTALALLGGVRYFVVPQGEERLLPAQFDQHVADAHLGSDDCSLYATDLVLPMAYATDGVVARADFDRMTPVQRQEAMLGGVVLEDVSTTPAAAPASTAADFSLDVEPSAPDALGPNEGLLRQAGSDPGAARIEGDSVVVTESGQYVYVNYRGAAAGERYLTLRDVSYVPTPETRAATVARINVIDASAYLAVDQFLNTNHMYGGKDDWAVDLHEQAAGDGTIALQFGTPGTYTLGDVSVETEDPEALLGSARALAARGASDIDYSGNHLACRVDGAADGDYLVARVPYGDGWSATVNGQDVEPLQANVGFTAVPLQEGDNEVVLSYATPGLAAGALVSLAGVGCSVIVVRRWHHAHDDRTRDAC